MAAPASKVLGLPVLCGHGCLKSDSLRREEAGSSRLETWLCEEACLGTAVCVLLIDAVGPPGPVPVFCVMKMCYMCSVYRF